MLNKVSKGILFYFAYLPLFLLLIIKNIEDYTVILISSSALILIGVVLVWLLLTTINSLTPRKERVSVISNNNAAYLAFIVTYIIPLVMQISGVKDLIIIIFFLLLFAYFYVTTSLFCINPLLKIIFGYNIFEVSIEGKRYLLLSKAEPVGDVKLDIIKLDGDIVIEAR